MNTKTQFSPPLLPTGTSQKHSQTERGDSFTVKIVGSECGNSPEVPIETLNDASAKYRAFIEQNGLGG